MVKAIRITQPRIGVHKLYSLIKEDIKRHNIKMGRDGLYSLLAEENLLVKKKKRKPSITTNSKHWFRKYSNLIRDMKIIRPNQVWVSDITYFPVEKGFFYISMVTDAYSRRIMGYAIADNLEAFNSLLALEMALQQINKGEGKWLIHHSDRGVQYCCTSYVRHLKKHGIQISMTDQGDPLENAIAERINRTIKEELLEHLSFSNLNEAILQMQKAVLIYNYERPHMSCGMLTPEQAHSKAGEMKKYWKKETGNGSC
jgi:transposase InsO family protein